MVKNPNYENPQEEAEGTIRRRRPEQHKQETNVISSMNNRDILNLLETKREIFDGSRIL